MTPEALALPLVELQTRVNAAVQGGLFGRKQKLQAVVDELRPVLRTSDALAHKALPELLGALLHVQRAVQDLAARVIALPGLVLPLTWNPLTEAGQHYVTQQIAWLSWAGHALRPVPSEGPSSEPFPALLRSFVASPTGSGPGSAGLLATAAAALQQLSSLAGTDAQHWAGWSGAHGLVEQWARTAPGRQESEQQPLPLRRWLAFLEALHPLQGLGLDEAHRWLRTGRCHAEEARDAFEAGLARTAWLERAETTGLDLFDAQRHLATVQTFTSTTQKVREALVEVLPAQILAARPVRSEDSQKQLGTLTRELNRQRGKALGVRQLLHTYGSLITELMPCVLVSPDSVARFFPVGGELFDIVVFDEASQIRVADAVGAMGRARSVVVVGDSKQMPPTTFAEATVDAEEENEVEGENPVVQDEESILSECRQALVDRRLLSWHYRSADESLIAFSNEHYYEGKLSSFPGPVLPLAVGAAAALPNAHRAATGISLVRLEGVYLRSGDRKLLKTNALEARAVLDELQRRFDASPEAAPSIGVVTFNLPQRTQIEELIHEEGCDRMVESLKDPYGDSLFVKNLENVQGDERDVILFSTGFSPNEQGFVPLTLGPLNRQGGERRLNVAVTRARRQVIVFTSFDPSMLRTGPTTALGVQHLRDYLELAAGGTSSLGSGRSNNTPPDRHRDQIAQLLRKAGLVVHTDVGLSDFKIDIVVAKPELPQQPVLAILLDGLGWAKRETITDRDALPSSVLLGLMGWPAVERVWAPEWIADPLAVIERLAAVAAKVTTTTDRK